ncbi:MAG: PKD domain-containing protein [archaeon]
MKTKSMLIVLSLFLFITIVKAPTIETEVEVYVAPNSVDIGSSVMIEVNIDPDPEGNCGYEDVLITVTGPDTTTSVLGPFNTDQFGQVRALFTPTQLGTYSVTVSYSGIILDENNYTAGESTTNFVVQSEIITAPTALFSFSPYFPEVDETIHFSAVNSFDSNSNIISYLWDYGDGSATVSGMNVTHAYASEGTYIVTLTVTNEDEISDQVEQIVTVYPKTITPLIASFIYSPLEPVVNQPIVFDASDTNEIDFNTVTYFWSFGDQSDDEIGVMGVNVTHSYSSEGTYLVTLTVNSEQGIPDQVQKLITVYPQTLISPELTMTFSPNEPVVNEPILFNSSDCYDSDGEIVTYLWDFGDGITSTDPNPIHTYSEEGSYPITLLITDDDDLTDSITVEINVVEQNEEAIPEFSSWLILPLFLVVSVVVLVSRHYLRKNS